MDKILLLKQLIDNGQNMCKTKTKDTECKECVFYSCASCLLTHIVVLKKELEDKSE